MRLINLDDVLKQFPKADFDGDALENMKAYSHWKTDITGLFNILKSVPIIEACDDCISREVVKEMLMNEWTKYMPMESDVSLSFVLEKISELSSVTPKRPKGNWKPLNYKDEMWGYVYKCSNCGATEYGYNYCPNCGANMEVE